MTGDLSFTADSWSELMRDLTPMEQLYSVYRAKDFSQSEAAALAGYRPSSVKTLRNQGHNIESRPRVQRAIAALRQHHQSQHRETIYARA